MTAQRPARDGRTGGRRAGATGTPDRSAATAADDPAADDPVAAGREICLRALTVMPRTEAELAQAMRRKGVPDDAAAEVLRRLRHAGLIDDEAFAQAWVSSRHGGKGLAKWALAGELRRKGVDDAVVRAAVDQVDDDDELVAATVLVRRRLPSTAGLPLPARVRRLTSMLARKGYSGSVSARVVREVLGAEADEVLAVPDDRFP